MIRAYLSSYSVAVCNVLGRIAVNTWCNAVGSHRLGSLAPCSKKHIPIPMPLRTRTVTAEHHGSFFLHQSFYPGIE